MKPSFFSLFSHKNRLWQGLVTLLLIGVLVSLSPHQSADAAVDGWNALTGPSGTGTSGVVNILQLDSSNNLYVGGSFATAGGVTVNSIAKWNGTGWSGLSTGLTSGVSVRGLAFDSANNLYITGSFDNIGGLPGATRGNAAKWDGTTWGWLTTTPYINLTAASNNVVIDSSNNVYFGGTFGGAGNAITPMNYITRYNDFATFSTLTDATTTQFGVNNVVYALALDGSNQVYAGGLFTSAAGVANTARIARFNGTNWLPLGAGIDNGQVNALAFDSLGNLYVGGSFTTVNGGTPAAGIAMWNGTTWSALGSGVTGGGVNAIAITPDNVVYVGGNFTSAGGVSGTANLARWSGGWRALPEGTPAGAVNALKYDTVNKYLYVGGSFTNAGSPAVTVNNVTIYQPGGLVVTTALDTIDANGGNCVTLSISQLPGADGVTSLREAICAANAAPGIDSITFSSSLDGTPLTLTRAGTGEDANSTGDLDITDTLNITGNGTSNTIVQAGTTTANGIDRAFHIVSNVSVNLSNLTIRYGRNLSENGGGIENNGTLNISGSVITQNAGFSGGGIHNTFQTVTISNSTISNNAGTYGGGISNDQGTLTLQQSTVSGNVASGNGGGIDSDAFGVAATLNVYNSTISGNTASFSGGGILAYTGGAGNTTVNLINATIFNNGGTGGLYSWATGAGTAIFNMQNSLIADQAGATTDCSADTGFFVSNNYNLASDGTCNLTQPNDIPTGTANLGALQDNGGATQTHALQSGSQALDAGNNTVCAASPINNVDQRGTTRPQNTTCDIGAFEYVAPVAPGTSGGNGPGGVGVTDGTSSLELWLNAGTGVTTAGGSVSTWADQSGNSAHVQQSTATNQPLHVTNQLNGQPIVRFDGNNDYLDIPTSVIQGRTAFSFFTAFKPNGSAAWQRLWDFGQDTNVYGYVTTNWNGLNSPRFGISTTGIGAGEQSLSFPGSLTIGSTELVELIFTGSNGYGFQKGGAQGSAGFTLTPNSLGSITQNRIGRSTFNVDAYLNADMGEFVVYSTALNDTDRILVENYLSAKYNMALSGTDVYDGDTNGDFDLNVAGIGQTGGNTHTLAYSAGMIVVNRTFLNENGDWLLFGHKTPANVTVPDDLPSGNGWDGVNDRRWARHWYIDVTEASTPNGTVDIIFDFSEGGMTGLPPDNPVSNYRLLKRSGTTGTFTDITTASGATVVITGDQVQFLGVNVSQLGSNFTLGTLDFVDSPTALTLQSFTARAGTLPVMGLLALIGLGLIGWVFRRRS